MVAQVVDNNGTLELRNLAGGSSDGLPVGSILAIHDTRVPYGFLPCNGSTYDINQYPALYTVIHSNRLPDLREMNLVGIGSNSTANIATHDTYTLGQFKDDQTQETITGVCSTAESTVTDPGHCHSYNVPTELFCAYSGSSNKIYCTVMQTQTSTSTTGISVDTSVTSTLETNANARTGCITHGKNYGVFFVIKAVTGAVDIDDATVYAQVVDLLEDNYIQKSLFSDGGIPMYNSTTECFDQITPPVQNGLSLSYDVTNCCYCWGTSTTVCETDCNCNYNVLFTDGTGITDLNVSCGNPLKFNPSSGVLCANNLTVSDGGLNATCTDGSTYCNSISIMNDRIRTIACNCTTNVSSSIHQFTDNINICRARINSNYCYSDENFSSRHERYEDNNNMLTRMLFHCCNQSCPASAYDYCSCLGLHNRDSTFSVTSYATGTTNVCCKSGLGLDANYLQLCTCDSTSLSQFCTESSRALMLSCNLTNNVLLQSTVTVTPSLVALGSRICRAGVGWDSCAFIEVNCSNCGTVLLRSNYYNCVILCGSCKALYYSNGTNSYKYLTENDIAPSVFCSSGSITDYSTYAASQTNGTIGLYCTACPVTVCYRNYNGSLCPITLCCSVAKITKATSSAYEVKITGTNNSITYEYTCEVYGGRTCQMINPMPGTMFGTASTCCINVTCIAGV